MTQREHNFLNVPSVPPVNNTRNFIKQVVCELRFPTLFELENDRPPAAFAAALRKEYPVYEYLRELQVGADSSSTTNFSHVFRNKQGWHVTLRSSSVVIETTKYTSFQDFLSRVSAVIKAAERVIDSDFFTRIGLRYINAVPYDQEEIDNWINPDLVKPLSLGIYGSPPEHSGRVSGTTKEGGFTFSHGLADPTKRSELAYVIDLDFFSEDVTLQESADLISRLHEHEFNMFYWALGEKARQFLVTSNK